MKVIVCGSVDFSDWANFIELMDYWDRRLGIQLVISGGRASLDVSERSVPWDQRRKWGAEHFAMRWAAARGLKTAEEPVSEDDLKKHGKDAIRLQNRRMIDRYKPDRVIDFRGGEATKDLLNQARAAGIKCIEVA